jgi:hypothetical protein
MSIPEKLSKIFFFVSFSSMSRKFFLASSLARGPGVELSMTIITRGKELVGRVDGRPLSSYEAK